MRDVGRPPLYVRARRPAPSAEPTMRRIGVLALGARHTLAQALECVDKMLSIPYGPDVPAPTRSSATRTKELLLASGALSKGGPPEVLLSASVKGGLVMTLKWSGLDLSVASMNNQVSVLIWGKGWSGTLRVEELDHRDAVERVRTATMETCA